MFVLFKNFRPILQFVAIKRGDTGEWALPGGMVDPGEKVTVTAVREFQEEAINSFVMSQGKYKLFYESNFCLYVQTSISQINSSLVLH